MASSAQQRKRRKQNSSSSSEDEIPSDASDVQQNELGVGDNRQLRDGIPGISNAGDGETDFDLDWLGNGSADPAPRPLGSFSSTEPLGSFAVVQQKAAPKVLPFSSQAEREKELQVTRCLLRVAQDLAHENKLTDEQASKILEIGREVAAEEMESMRQGRQPGAAGTSASRSPPRSGDAGTKVRMEGTLDCYNIGVRETQIRASNVRVTNMQNAVLMEAKSMRLYLEKRT
mmetsp:Transcript_18614/g.46457  ORF Transcript_18614/g.46457 Transcript_18614/m.46457 type:complete len:230 (+) Transcript_18614:214-903(+)|eukprot:CAMPEP_0178989044 /NCGR_PEP_ID=MMETSP0795-20121207/4138_1 /TAXON_ID=88552 /ORGANISM="Amoebophrya sp., Strain Ameob2" /LENGTH=229 /DNA_ID=CAMNT_0020680367 /DNA_START=139 /DNA_END=828 /DNA_ORIENTATION=+